MTRADFLVRVPLAACEPTRVKGRADVTCPRCREVLDRHLPDQDRPDRQLGVCFDCGGWFLIDVRHGLLYAVPDVWALPPRATG